MNIFKIAISKYKKKKEARLRAYEESLSELFDELVENQVLQERLIDKGISKEILSDGAYGDLDRSLGRLIVSTARLAYGLAAADEIKIRMMSAILKVESEIGRDITDKQDVISGISEIK